MATLAENITEMAALTANLKKTFRLSEGTVLRLIDMNLAIQSQPGRFQPPISDEPTPLPPTDEELAAMLGITPSTDEETTEDEPTEVVTEEAPAEEVATTEEENTPNA